MINDIDVSDKEKYIREKFSENQLGSLLRIVPLVSENSSIESIHKIFECRNLKTLPVEGRDGRLLGLIKKSSLKTLKASSWSILKNRTIKHLIDKNMFILDSKEYIEKALLLLLEKEKEEIFEDFVIFNYNSYFGMGNFFELITQVSKLKNTALDNAKKLQMFFINKNESVRLPFKLYKYIVTSNRLGGDFYKVLKISEDKFLVSIFDVSGKNVPASLITVVLSSFFSTIENTSLLKCETLDYLEIAKSLNKVCFDQTNAWMFVTGILLFIDTSKKELEYFNFGHPPALFAFPDEYKEDSNILSTNRTLPPLGVSSFTPNLRNKSLKMKIKRNLKILMFTDGFPEAKNIDGEMFGTERIQRLTNNYVMKGAKILFTEIKDTLANFTKEKAFSDDVAILFLDFEELF